jgi:4-hydroxy-3-methylbut-2-enyl diphosphate reductase
LACATQTTLSRDDTEEVIAVLRRRFHKLLEPPKSDICYATTNRQNAVKSLAIECDAILVIGGANSSNSHRLVETATRAGCRKAQLIRQASDLDWDLLEGVKILGLTSGASTPEELFDEVFAILSKHYCLITRELTAVKESVYFKLPPALRTTRNEHPSSKQVVDSAELAASDNAGGGTDYETGASAAK